MKRRGFLQTAGALLAHSAWGSEMPDDLRITRIVGFDVVSIRPKLVGKNSRLDVHGKTARDRMVRIYTNHGIEGLGNCRANPKQLSQLRGKNPFDFYKRESRQMISSLGSGTMPLWDIAGKVLKKPVYELLGGAGPEKVPVYDGSIYFSDLLPQYSNNPLDRFKEEIDIGMVIGHRAFKVKIGRGAKWMPKEEGFKRDVEVLKTIHQHAGDDILIGVDANNGHTLASSKRLLNELPEIPFAFMEEMFPEEVEQCLALKQFLTEQGRKTLLADGETQGELEAYKPFIKAQAIDVLQGDMNRFGFEGILKEAAWAKPQGILVAPHNWGSLVGFYMQLHAAKAIANFYRAEHDPLTNSILIADGYAIHNGYATVPDAPGFGLKIDEEKFKDKVEVRFDLEL